MKSTTWKSKTVTSWFRTTCPPCLDETIQLLGNGAFTDNWFNTKYDLNLTKTDLVDLSVATKEHLFLFNGALYEKTDCVAMGSPIGPLPVTCSCPKSKKTLSERVNSLLSIEDMLTIRSPSCQI